MASNSTSSKEMVTLRLPRKSMDAVRLIASREGETRSAVCEHFIAVATGHSKKETAVAAGRHP